MNNDDGIILQMQEGGVWGIKEEPYCTIEVDTKEDYEGLQKALEKQTPRKPLEQSTDEKTYYKCICESIQKTAYKDGYQMGAERAYCDRCGQAIDWSVEE